MEVKKCYELRQLGNKVVLIGFTLSPCFGTTECRMNVLLEADELIEKSQYRISDNDYFFLLRVDKKFVLCRIIANQIYVSPPFEEYKYLHPDLLILQDVWMKWMPTERESMLPLGNYIWDNFPIMFAYRQNNVEASTILSYYEDGMLKRMECKKFMRLDDKLKGINSTMFSNPHYDVLSLVDMKGRTLWLSIEHEIGPLCACSGQYKPRSVKYHFIFSLKPHE